MSGAIRYCLAIAALLFVCQINGAAAADCVDPCFSIFQESNGSGTLTGTTINVNQCMTIPFTVGSETGNMYTLQTSGGKYVSATAGNYGPVQGKFRGAITCSNCAANPFGVSRIASVNILQNGNAISTTAITNPNPQSFNLGWGTNANIGDVFSAQVCVNNGGALMSATFSGVDLYGITEYNFALPF